MMFFSKLPLLLMIHVLSHYTPSPYLKDANEVRDETITQIERSTPLRAAGVGGAMLGSIKMLGLAFSIKKELSINEAREYVVYCTRRLLTNTNNKKELEPYLTPFPFSPQNLEISLYIQKVPPPLAKLNDLRMALLKEGQIKYISIDGKTHKSKILYKETYEEALEIVQEKVEAMEEASHSQKSDKGLFRKFIGFFR